MEASHHARFGHHHDFGPDRSQAEKNTRRVIVLNAVMMTVEILAGWRFHSMALLADGWHMSTHVAAFLITASAYALARRYRGDRSFSFGTGKIDVLGAYTSAILLGVVAVFMALESAERLFAPLPIHYRESIAIAALGLCVNVASALLLGHDHSHGHDHDHGHDHEHDDESGHDHDLNLRAAYVHVLADAVTSVLAIGALAAGKYLGWKWLDPVVGLVGAAVVAQWSWGLLRQAGGILLDRTPASTDLVDEIRRAVEDGGEATVTDLHVWQLGSGQYSAIVCIATNQPHTPDYYRERFSEHSELRHVTIEINPVGR